MADQVFMFAITAGVFTVFTALLFTARAKRYSQRFKPVSKGTSLSLETS